MKGTQEIETTNSTEWYDATLDNEKPTRLSGLIFVLLAVMMIFATAAYGAVDTWSLGILSCLAGLVVVFWMADAFVSKVFRFSPNLLQIPVLGLILIGIVQIIPLGNISLEPDLLSITPVKTLSIDPNLTRLAIVQLLIYFVFFAAGLAYINTQKRLRKMVFIIIIFGSIWSFFGIIQWLSQIGSIDLTIYGLRPVTSNLPFASFVNKHHFAGFMEMTIGLTLSLLYGESTKKDNKLLLVIAVVLMGSGLVLTGSRGGLVSLLGVIGFVTFFSLSQKKSKSSDHETQPVYRQKKLILIGASITLVLVLFTSVIFLGGESSLMRGTGLNNPDEISNGRFHFWQMSLQIIKDHPIIGTGLDTFGVAFTRYDTWNGKIRVEQAHNEYLHILSDAGVLGFACFVFFMILLFKNGLRNASLSSDRYRRAVAIGAIGGCVGIIIHSFFDFPLRTPSNLYFFLMLAVLATNTIIYPKLYRHHAHENQR